MRTINSIDELTKGEVRTALAALTGNMAKPANAAEGRARFRREAEKAGLSESEALELVAVEVGVEVASNGTEDEPEADAECDAVEQSGADGIEVGANEPDRKPRRRKDFADTKFAQLVELLKRPGGATSQEVSDELLWSKHTARRAINVDLQKKYGFAVQKSKLKGEPTRYAIAE